MGLTDKSALHLHKQRCDLHPVVLFSIIDHYSRREGGQERVIGTLLGYEVEGVVQICSCFPVPHTETEEQVAVNTDFHATMLHLHQRVHPKQKVVGWYSTGEEVNDSSMLFHDFYGQDVERPVHLLLDLGLGERRMSCKAFVSSNLAFGEMCLGTVFEEMSLIIVNNESDRVGIDTLLKASGEASHAANNTSPQDVDSLEITIKKLLRTLDGGMEYVDKVKSGVVTADHSVIGLMQEMMAAAPRLPASNFDAMFNSQVQDMLMVVYLANLTRTQLALAEKLQAVTISAANE